MLLILAIPRLGSFLFFLLIPVLCPLPGALCCDEQPHPAALGTQHCLQVCGITSLTGIPVVALFS